MLELNNVQTFYGSAQALFGLSMRCDESQVTTLLGKNGMGKTAAVHAITGLVRPRAGEIRLDGEKINGKTPFEIANLGVALAPEGRQIFPNLNARENLIATARPATHKDAWTLDRVLDFFPPLQARLNHMGAQLSGGEQQMLSIGRALMRNPRLLILDEATEGLAPLVRAEIRRRLRQLKQTGLTILLIDKNPAELARIGDRHYLIEKGRAVWNGDSNALLTAGAREKYLGV